MKQLHIFKRIKFGSEYAIIVYLVILKILIHLINTEYGYHRDELFFLYISDNYNFSNLDVLPLTPIYLKLITLIFGTSIKAIHFASGLLGAASLAFTCLIAKELGGKKFAILLSGLSIILSGFLIFGAFFSYDSFDFLAVVISLYFLVKLFKENNPKYFLPVGIAIGFALLNKLTILFFCASIFASFLLVRQRKFLLNKWIYFATVLSLILFIPFLVWQYLNDWYFINWAGNYAGTNSYVAPIGDFILNQILPNNIINIFIWLTGLIVLLFVKKWKNYKFFAFVYLAGFTLVYFMGGKFYFLIPYYAVLLVVGSIQIETLISRLKDRAYKIASFLIIFLYLSLSIVSVPLLMPMLSVKNYVKYVEALGMSPDAGVRYENNQLNDVLPQHFSDRFGWEEMTQSISDVYENLPKNIRDSVGGILCNNSGQAAAINFFRDKNKVPEAISAHGWFFYHAKETHTFGPNYISIYEKTEKLKTAFHQIDSIGYFTNPYCMPYETNKTIYICKKPKIDLIEFWETIKH